MTIVRVKVLFFGMLKDIVGRAEDHIEVADDARLESVFTRYAQPVSAAHGVGIEHRAGLQPGVLRPLGRAPGRRRNRVPAAGQRRVIGRIWPLHAS